jgi:hypothetical protein
VGDQNRKVSTDRGRIRGEPRGEYEVVRVPAMQEAKTVMVMFEHQGEIGKSSGKARAIATLRQQRIGCR